MIVSSDLLTDHVTGAGKRKVSHHFSHKRILSQTEVIEGKEAHGGDSLILDLEIIFN